MKAFSSALIFFALARSTNATVGPLLDKAKDFACLNPPNNWRIRQDLTMNWTQAQNNFQLAFGDPSDPKFAQRTQFGINPATFNATSATTWENIQLSGAFKNEFKMLPAVAPNCKKQQITFTNLLNSNQAILKPFLGIERFGDPETVSFVLGYEPCESDDFPPRFLNFVCNEAAIGGYLIISVKRYACMIDNYDSPDPVSICGSLTAPAPPV